MKRATPGSVQSSQRTWKSDSIGQRRTSRWVVSGSSISRSYRPSPGGLSVVLADLRPQRGPRLGGSRAEDKRSTVLVVRHDAVHGADLAAVAEMRLEDRGPFDLDEHHRARVAV